MLILPAIDLRGGKCVRLTQGDFKREIVYSGNPADQALTWQTAGAEFIHVVDLDGAKAGTPTNIFAIKKILDSVKIPIEVGGGIRTLNDAENLLELGVSRVIFGSVAVENPELVKEAVENFGGEKIVAGIDARDGVVAVHGWGDSGEMKADELAMRMGDCGVETIIYTDISRDGMLSGVDAKTFSELAEKSGVSIIASGGVGSLDDIRALKAQENFGVVGVIIGKALYEGVINLSDAIAIAG